MAVVKETAKKVSAKSRKVDWWDPQTPIPGYNPATRMLVNYAVSREKSVKVGVIQGYLLDVEDGSRQELVDTVLHITGGTIACTSEAFTGEGKWEALFVWPEGSVTFAHNSYTNQVHIEVSTTSKRTYSRLCKACSVNVVKNPYETSTYSLSKDSHGILGLVEIGDASTPFEPRNYDPVVRMAYDFTCKELSSSNPSGRLTLVHGAPGSGKTYFIRGLLHDIKNARFVLVPSNLAEDLGGPTLIPALAKARVNMDPQEPLILIIEDADRCLGSRDTAMDAISSILNASDGILGSSLNLRIICTTNAKYDKLDPALSRAGRLSLEVLVGELSHERALKIYRRLVGDPNLNLQLPEEVTLAQVYDLVKKNEDVEEDDSGGDPFEDD
jgi:hypothetical protein